MDITASVLRWGPKIGTKCGRKFAGEGKMIISVLLSGFLAGFAALIGAISFGLPLWAAVMLYAIAGTTGAVGFMSLTFARLGTSEVEGAHEFAAKYH